jgi:hypothetical protein
MYQIEAISYLAVRQSLWTKEEEMSGKDLSPEERATRGKRLMIYGMFSLVVVTMVTMFLVLYLYLGPWGAQHLALRATLIVGAVAIVACIIVWFIYTKLILKE